MGRLSRRHDHHDLAAFFLWKLLNFGNLIKIILDTLQKVRASILVSHFAPPKSQSYLDLVAILKKPLHRPDFYIVIVIINIRAHLDLFDLDYFLLLLRFSFFLLLLVFIFTVIENFTNWRLRIWGYLDEIKARLNSDFNRVLSFYNAAFLAFMIN